MVTACVEPRPLYRPRDPRASDLWRLFDEQFDSFRQVYDGIGITLVTDRGTLVIESEDPDVQLEIVRDGNRAPVNDFQLRQNGEQVVLSSSEYEIRLKNATGNRLSLDRNRVLITRGDREVVRITRQPEEPQVENRKRTALYNGRSFSEWMSVLEQERSVEGGWDAIMGLITRATPDQHRTVAQASLVATRQNGSFFATEYFMQPGGFQANVSDSEGFMGKLKQYSWSLDTSAALAALLDELLTKHPRSTQACVALLSNVEPSRLAEHPDLVKQIRGVLTQLDFLEVARAMEGADQRPSNLTCSTKCLSVSWLRQSWGVTHSSPQTWPTTSSRSSWIVESMGEASNWQPPWRHKFFKSTTSAECRRWSTYDRSHRWPIFWCNQPVTAVDWQTFWKQDLRLPESKGRLSVDLVAWPYLKIKKSSKAS